jgi:hypothetical protein
VVSTHVRFGYPPELLNEPIMYELGKRFGVTMNLHRVNLGDTHRWVEMEVIGGGQDTESILAWARDRGLLVEPAAALLTERHVQIELTEATRID